MFKFRGLGVDHVVGPIRERDELSRQMNASYASYATVSQKWPVSPGFPFTVIHWQLLFCWLFSENPSIMESQQFLKTFSAADHSVMHRRALPTQCSAFHLVRVAWVDRRQHAQFLCACRLYKCRSGHRSDPGSEATF